MRENYNYSEVPKEEIDLLISLLSSEGFVADAGATFLSSTLIEWHFEGLVEILHKNGYSQPLNTIADYYPAIGAYYAVYDTTMFTRQEAKEYLDNYANKFGS